MMSPHDDRLSIILGAMRWLGLRFPPPRLVTLDPSRLLTISFVCFCKMTTMKTQPNNKGKYRELHCGELIRWIHESKLTLVYFLSLCMIAF
jgi:hypothetical protein